MSNAATVFQRYERALKRKQMWDVNYKEAMQFVAPNREIFTDVIAGGTELLSDGMKRDGGDMAFDSTAITGLSHFVSNIQSAMTPPGVDWCRLRAGSKVPAKQQEAQNKALEEITNTMFSFLRMSNFDSEIAVSYGDLGFGVGALHLAKGTVDNPFHFTAAHIADIALEEGAFGRVDGKYRLLRVPVRSILDMWSDAVLTDQLAKLLKEKPDERVSLLEVTIPKFITLVDAEGKRRKVRGFCYEVYDKATKACLLSREQESSPWIIFRWTPLPGEVYARGPVLQALPDIKTINKVKELLLKRGSRDLYGIYTYLDDGVINLDNVTFGSNCFIPVEFNGGPRGPAISVLPPTGDMNLAQFLFTDLQGSINKILFAEPLGRVDLPVKSATEVAIRQQELSRRIGPSFGRLQYELIVPLVNRMLYILDELGLIDMSGFKVDGQFVNIDYLTPLAQAKELQELENMERYAATMLNTFGPEVGLALINIEQYHKRVASHLNVPSELLPSEQDLATMKEALMVKAMQQQVGQDPAMAAQMASSGQGGMVA